MHGTSWYHSMVPLVPALVSGRMGKQEEQEEDEYVKVRERANLHADVCPAWT